EHEALCRLPDQHLLVHGDRREAHLTDAVDAVRRRRHPLRRADLRQPAPHLDRARHGDEDLGRRQGHPEVIGEMLLRALGESRVGRAYLEPHHAPHCVSTNASTPPTTTASPARIRMSLVLPPWLAARARGAAALFALCAALRLR